MTSLYTKIPGKAVKQPAPYTISIPESQLADFKVLLKLSKVAAPTYESSQEDRRYGVSSKWLTEAKAQWENRFDWRTCEKNFNSFPNFKMPIMSEGDEFDVHFVALFSNRVDAVPILLLHGWPGSFIEFLPLLSLMRDQYSPDELPYHLIVPSLPGYSFSSTPPLDRDFGTTEVASIMNSLMINLGFIGGYVAQGGDIGSRLARILAVRHDSCKAAHVNFCFMAEPKDVPVDSLSATERQGVLSGRQFLLTGVAYALEHGSRTSTIGLVLSSSPLALLAWIGEKFLEWSDEDPPLDTILESVTLYWLTETFPRGIYPYRQRFTPHGSLGTPDDPEAFIHKPFGYSWYPKEIAPCPKSWASKTGNLVFYAQHDKGGHFAALEQPKVFKEDLEAFVKEAWPSPSSGAQSEVQGDLPIR